MLMLGQKVNSVYNNEELTVVRKLGEGGQGEVYRVQDAKGKMKALKWYNREQSTVRQRQAIEHLVQEPLNGTASEYFVWPQDLALIDGEYQRFGYVMDEINMSRFAELGEVMAKLKPAPYMKQRCIISENLAAAFRRLHLKGYYYSDISMENFMFEPSNGQILICDNDNIGVPGFAQPQVLGTMEFMAPEVILGKSKPSPKTDLYSLAVLLFYFWVWHHPMHGQKEYQIRIWDIPAKRRIYGEEPVFIFNPQDRSNNLPADDDYRTAQMMWDACPEPLKRLFIRSFTDGLHDAAKRVTEGEWQNAFAALQRGVVTCKCRAQNFWWEGCESIRCWHCHSEVKLPMRLTISTAVEKKHLFVVPDMCLYLGDIDVMALDEIKKTQIGKLVQNPNNPAQWGLRNLGMHSWHYRLPDGEIKEVPPQRALPLNPQLELLFNEQTKGKFEA